MTTLLIGLLLFLGTHSISIVAPAWRDGVAQRLGAARWQLVYSLVSALGFYLIVRGYSLAAATPTVLYSPPRAFGYLALLLMLPAFPLLFAAYLPGRIRDAVGHPMLIATTAWALAHLLSNGTLADVVLFGTVLAWAIADRNSMKRRTQRPIRTAPRRALNDFIAVVGGLAVFAFFVGYAHRAWFGVSPLP